MTTAYPLTWPDGLPRTERRSSSQMRTELHTALKNVNDSLRLFGTDTAKPVTNVVLSSNVTLGNEKPNDPGVAVWFVWEGAQCCFAVDRYPSARENLQAIHHIIEARRVEFRHGGLHIVRQTFKGFQALPAPARQQAWWEVLGVQPGASLEAVEAAYRAKAPAAHPDRPGGSHDAMQALNAARSAARKARA